MDCRYRPQRRADASPKIGGRYRTSPSERAILDAVGPARVPRSAFLGRQRQSVTRYHYGDDGRLTHAVTTHDEEWTADDAAAQLEYDAEQRLICRCGHPLDRTTDPALRQGWEAKTITCHACAAEERAREGARKANGNNGHHAAGKKYQVVDRFAAVDP